jgi:hypothetical protein
MRVGNKVARRDDRPSPHDGEAAAMKVRRDIEQARAKMSPSIGYWREIGAVAKLVERTEVVLRIAGGLHDQQRGVLVLTDRRLLYVSARHARWSLSLGEIEAVSCARSDLFGTVTVRTRDRVFEVNFVDSNDAVALVTAAGGTWSRVPRDVAIAS